MNVVAKTVPAKQKLMLSNRIPQVSELNVKTVKSKFGSLKTVYIQCCL